MDPLRGQRRRGRRVADAVRAEHFGRDALERLAREVGLLEEPAVGVVMDVEKAGTDDEAPGIHDAPGRVGRELAEARDAVPLHGDVERTAAAARAVDDVAPLDQ